MNITSSFTAASACEISARQKKYAALSIANKSNYLITGLQKILRYCTSIIKNGIMAKDFERNCWLVLIAVFCMVLTDLPYASQELFSSSVSHLP